MSRRMVTLSKVRALRETEKALGYAWTTITDLAQALTADEQMEFFSELEELCLKEQLNRMD